MGLHTSVKLISYSEVLKGPVYTSSNCAPVKASKFEPAGHAFHSAALKLFGCEEKAVEVEEQNVSEKGNTDMPSFESYVGKGKKGDKQDHYALLGLGHLRYLATEDQIKKSYRETCLKYHPDKLNALLREEKSEAAKQSKKDEIDAHFKAIQQGYHLLIDPAKRRMYDSTDEFDDEIPTDCTPQDFFKVFGPAFIRNGRWSVNQPLPSLGDENTPLKEVDNFYNFWYGFKSWREFQHEDEYDLEEAETRDHKRWMERQNAKLTEKPRKEEAARIRSLVDNAYKKDPRILSRKEKEKAEKQKKKNAKLLAKKLEEEEAMKGILEEQRRKEEEAKCAAEASALRKKEREKEKKLLRKERARLRTLSAPILSACLLKLSADDVENQCTTLSFEQLKSLCDEMEKKEGLELALVLGVACGYSYTEEDKAEAEKKIPQQNGSVPQSNGHVTLGKTEKKENLMAETENSKKSNGEDIRSLVNGMAANGISEVSEQDVWSAVQEKAMVQALKNFPKESKMRWERVAAAVPGKNVNQCKKKFASMRESFRSKKA